MCPKRPSPPRPHPRSPKCGPGWFWGGCLAFLSACGGSPAASGEAEDWPEGTVLVLDGTPISAEEVDRDCASIVLIYPADSPEQLRRRALNNITFPRFIARDLSDGAWESSRDRARETAQRIAEGLGPTEAAGPPSPEGNHDRILEGYPLEVGLNLWAAATRLEPGVWSEPLEEPGGFHLIRVLEQQFGSRPSETRVKIAVLDFPYLGRTQVESIQTVMHNDARLEIVDPAWKQIVPELTQYRMGVHDDDE